MKNGINFEQYKKQIIPSLQKKGWWGEVQSTNPTTGETKTIYVGSRRLRTIFDTNMRVSYNKGRYQSQMESLGEYFYYSAVLDGATRPSHSKLHGTILPKTHPFWDINYPPNDWNCRCKVRCYTKKELEQRNLTPSIFTPPNIAHKDWSYNVGKTDNLASVINSKIDKLEDKKLKDIAQKEFKALDTLAFKEVAKKQLNEMIDEVIINKNQKYPINYIVVGSLLNTHLKAIKEHLNKDLKEANIILHKNNLTHSDPKRKGKYGHAFKIEEIRQIVDVLDNIDNAYIDIKHNNLIFIFDDVDDINKVNYIPVELIRKIKKFDTENYIITLDKRNRKNFEADLKGNILMKVKQ